MYRSKYADYFYIPLILAGAMLACEIAIAAAYDPLSNFCVTYVTIGVIVFTAVIGKFRGCSAENNKILLPLLWLFTGVVCLAQSCLSVACIARVAAEWKSWEESYWYVYLLEGVMIMCCFAMIAICILLAFKPMGEYKQEQQGGSRGNRRV